MASRWPAIDAWAATIHSPAECVDDLKVIFNGSGIDDGDFNWIAKTLHDKTRGPDLATFTGKVTNANSLTDIRSTINSAFTTVEQSHLLEFPGPW